MYSSIPRRRTGIAGAALVAAALLLPLMVVGAALGQNATSGIKLLQIRHMYSYT
jgi:hypothetical protein